MSQTNYTLTHYAEHCKKFSHDALQRYLEGEKLRPNLVWENVRSQVEQTPRGYLIFDDLVCDERKHTFDRELQKGLLLSAERQSASG